MKNIFKLYIILCLLCCIATDNIFAQTGANPIYRDVFTADPAPLVYNDTLFVYVGHDEAFNGEMFLITEWLCYSTTDMVNWTAHGSVMRPEHFQWDPSNPNAVQDAWAAQVVHKNGRFYLYTTCTWGGRTVGVAVSDSPYGPFVDARGTPLVSGTPGPVESAWDNIDPTVLIDDDGSAYIAWGNPTCYFAKLKDNMIEIDGNITTITPPNYAEGPWLSKRNDTYYLTYAAFPTNGSEQICYSTAPTIQGPWTYQGILTGSAANSYTIHPGVVNYKGNDYLFYHYADYTINGVHGTLGLRSVCAEYLCYNDNGTMQPVTQTTAGVTVAPPCPSQQYPDISFTSPAITAFVEPANVPFDVEVSDGDGEINHIDFYLNEESDPFHEEWAAPYGFDYLFEEAGEYTIRAIAYDSDNNSDATTITITVHPPQSPYGGTAHPIPGTIQIENYDIGGNGFAYFDDSEDNTGGADFRMDEDVDLEDCSDVGGGYNLGWSTVGEWLEYTVNVETAGSYDIVVRAANTAEGKTISLAIDDTDIATDIAIPNTTDWQAWEDVLIEDIQLEAGEQVLKITIGGGDYINLNYMSFTLRPLPVDPIQLHAGWNMIGYPYTSNATLEDALSNILDNLLFVKDDDGYFDANGTPDLNSLTELQYGRGYHVKVDANCELNW